MKLQETTTTSRRAIMNFSIKSASHEKKGPQGKIRRFVSYILHTIKTTFKVKNLVHRWILSQHSFTKSEHFFPFWKKGRGDIFPTSVFVWQNISEPSNYLLFLSDGSAINLMALRANIKVYTFFFVNSIFHLSLWLLCLSHSCESK